MARKNFVADFETTTDPADCRVWAYGYMEVGNIENYSMGNNIEDFMVWLEKEKANVYFHNLRFDGEFICNWLLQQGYTHDSSGLPGTFDTVISKMGQWYMIDICYGFKGKRKLHSVIYDSMKKFPMSVESVGKAYKVSVQKIEEDSEFYERYRPIGHELDPEEIMYLKHDLQVMAEALKIQFDEGLTKMTNAADALSEFKDIFDKKRFERMFPILSETDNDEIRMAYKGGFTWLNKKYASKDVGKGVVFDVNSLYPSQMYSRPLPYGKPIKFSGAYQQDDEYPLYTVHIRCAFELKDNYIPTIQIKNNRFYQENEYLESSNYERVDLYLSSVDLSLFFRTL